VSKLVYLTCKQQTSVEETPMRMQKEECND